MKQLICVLLCVCTYTCVGCGKNEKMIEIQKIISVQNKKPAPEMALTYDYISYKSAEIMPMFVIVAMVVLCATSIYNCCKTRNYINELTKLKDAVGSEKDAVDSVKDVVDSVKIDTQRIVARVPKKKFNFDSDEEMN